MIRDSREISSLINRGVLGEYRQLVPTNVKVMVLNDGK